MSDRWESRSGLVDVKARVAEGGGDEILGELEETVEEVRGAGVFVGEGGDKLGV